MAKKCVYCRTEIPNESVIDFCEKCGIGAFGSRTFKAIINNMETAKKRGDLDQNSSF